MFRQYRTIAKGEFIIAGGDCSQGGSDFNCTQFFSKTRLDVPLVYHQRGVAATQTTDILPVLNKIADITGVQPVVGLERNMGGASEMERLKVLNKDNKYRLFLMPIIGSDSKSGERSDKLGVDTSALSRPILVGGLKEIIDVNGLGIYDRQTIDELAIFIENSRGKPEAATGGHDDTVMSLAIAWYMSLFELPVTHSVDSTAQAAARQFTQNIQRSFQV